MKAEDLKGKTEDELTKLLLDARKDQFNMRFQRVQGSLENTAEMRKKRRNIARIKTFLTMTRNGAAAPVKATKAPAKKKTAKAAAKA